MKIKAIEGMIKLVQPELKRARENRESHVSVSLRNGKEISQVTIITPSNQDGTVLIEHKNGSNNFITIVYCDDIDSITYKSN